MGYGGVGIDGIDMNSGRGAYAAGASAGVSGHNPMGDFQEPDDEQSSSR